MTDLEIESALRNAPRPAAPPGLRGQLEREIALPRNHARTRPGESYTVPWWRRWIPALAFGMIFLSCIVILAMQTSQLLQLRRENTALRAAAAELAQMRQENRALLTVRNQAQELERLRRDHRELEQWRAEAASFPEQTAQLERLRADNQRLQAELANLRRRLPAGAAGEHDPFAEAKAKALRIACINNLKQVGLAARLWANDNQDRLPENFLTMTNELGTPKILACPADTGRKPSANWAEFTLQQLSYEILSPGADEKDPEIVYARCPIHNSVCLVDGSVQQLGPQLQVAKVDGKMKIIKVTAPENSPAPER